MFRHLLPNAAAPIIVNATLIVGGTILTEAALSFLGYGVQPPNPSWGSIIQGGQPVLADAWWIATLPGLAIVFTVVSFNLLGDALRDALDPRMKT
jgi:peptide/nickel transport system permease protein